MKKLAIIITHPIQYYVPVFRLLAKQCELKVFYTWGEQGVKEKYDPDFGKTIAWDLLLLDGYDYELLENIAKDPGSHHGKGIINPDIVVKLEAFAPDAILIYGYIYQSHFKVMRHFKGKTPIWFRGDSTLLDEEKKFKSIAKKFYLKWVYGFVDKAFYVGTHNKAYFEKYGLKEDQLIFAPHAIDNERFAEDRNAEVEKLRNSLNIRKEDILILFAGKLEPKKNPTLLLEAFIQLVDKTAQTTHQPLSPYRGEMSTGQRGAIHLLFVGNGVLEESLKSEVKSQKIKEERERKLSANHYRITESPNKQINEYTTNEQQSTNRIHFLDFQNQTQMPVVYQACDIFCLPSQGPGETWGLAVNEAMAASKAIIASDKVGCEIDLVQNDVNGYSFKSNVSEDLKGKLQQLVSEPNRIAIFGHQSKELIQNWSFEQQTKQFLKTLNEI